MNDVLVIGIVGLALIAGILISFGWEEYRHYRRVKRIAARGVRRF